MLLFSSTVIEQYWESMESRGYKDPGSQRLWRSISSGDGPKDTYIDEGRALLRVHEPAEIQRCESSGDCLSCERENGGSEVVAPELMATG